MEENIRNAAAAEEEEVFSLKDFLVQCSAKWKWFAFSILFFLCIGALYIMRQQPEYSRSMSVLIKDQDGGGSVADLSSAFSSMGLVSSNTNVNNELISLTSPAVMYEVINRLGLQTSYTMKGDFHGVTLYGKTLPFIVTFADVDDQESAGFSMEYNPDGTVKLYKFYNNVNGERVKYDETVSGRVDGKAIRTPIGRLVLTANPGYAPKKKMTESCIIKVHHGGMQDCVEYYAEKLKGDLADKEADVIDLSIKDVSIERAEDILNTVLIVYNENWVEDKNKIAVATSNFIDERLRIIEQELGVVDEDISKYQSEHLITDFKEAAKVNMEQTTLMSNQLLSIHNQLAMTTFINDYLQNPANNKNVIPVNTGIGSTQLEAQIAAYNNVLLTRNNVAANSSDTNPLVLDYDAQLKGMRESIVKSVKHYISALNTNLTNIAGAKGEAQSQLASAPTQAKYLLSVERQQKVKESLYLYLLQKREENELTQTFTAYNTRVITPPMGSLRPVAPRNVLIMLVVFLLGVIIPGLIIYIQEATNSKVRGRKDLESMSTPFAGEIPFAGRRNHFKWLYRLIPSLRKKKEESLESVMSAVQEGRRDAISESFRIVRGNVDFMLQKEKGTSVIMVTSFNPGSGKSFISFNLASSFALKNKRVLIVDGDLRHGSVSQFVKMPAKGISNYLTGATDDWRSLVRPVKEREGIFVMPIGHRPPNPSELLDNGRIETLLEEARKEYDYVLLDCPPVDIVVDTQILEKYVDRTLFVVRAGLLEKKSVKEIDNLYKNKRFKQMSIILNGTDSSHARHRSYGSYGYYISE